MSLQECKETWLKNCLCKAYASSDILGGSGCLMWFGDFIDVRELSVIGSEDSIYICLAASNIRKCTSETIISGVADFNNILKEVQAKEEKKMELHVRSYIRRYVCIPD